MLRDITTIIYVILGVIPAVILACFSIYLLILGDWKVHLYGISIWVATIALWAAAYDNSPIFSKKRIIILCALVLGIVLLFPMASTYFEALLSNKEGYFKEHIGMFYLSHGPIIIAAYYIIVSLYKMASNKSFNFAHKKHGPDAQ